MDIQGDRILQRHLPQSPHNRGDQNDQDDRYIHDYLDIHDDRDRFRDE